MILHPQYLSRFFSHFSVLLRDRSQGIRGNPHAPISSGSRIQHLFVDEVWKKFPFRRSIGVRALISSATFFTGDLAAAGHRG